MLKVNQAVNTLICELHGYSKLYITSQFTARIQVFFSHAINLKKTAFFSTIIGLKVKIKIVSLNRLKRLVTFSVILKI
jgi:hypothetical protein